MTIKVPQFKDIEVTNFLVQMVQENDRARLDVLNAHSANRSVLLFSPAKKVYELTVDDSGVLHITKVAG